MCILFIHTNPRPEIGNYRLILASNRDEYFIRNAQVAQKWPDNPSIISGIDLEPGREGGTWLGLSVNQKDNSAENTVRVGALLNVTGEPRFPGAAGRGFIVTDYLKNPQISINQYLDTLQCGEKKYNAFNFVAVEVGNEHAQVCHFTNAGNNEILKFESINTLSFGNSLPQAPLSKVQAGRERFIEIINKLGNVSHNQQLVTELIDLLKWEKRHLPDNELQRRAPDSYEYLSSVCVNIPVAGYGTRTHTIILVDWQGEVHYVEETMECPIDQQNPKWIKQDIKAHL